MPARRDERGRCRRGTSNANSRGSAAARRRSRAAMVALYGSCGVVTCWLCDVPLLAVAVEGDPESAAEVFERDRVLPGAAGGRYVLENLRPACGPCNRDRGNGLL